MDKTEETNENKQHIDISMSLFLRFQEHIVTDLVQDDGLVILGRGLGLNQIVANLLHVLGQATIRDKRALIMLINASEDENAFLEETLMELSWRRGDASRVGDSSDVAESGHVDYNFVSLLGDAGTVDKRRKTYSKGGIISLSNRVLVTDILSNVIEAEAITGLVILHAENISQYSMDRFVLNLYRKSNKWGFVKAFSEDPEKCSRGFQPLQTKLKYFKLDKSFLWPRFHIGVTESIKRKMKSSIGIKSDNATPINKVTEIRIKMTDYMLKIQNALMASIELLIGELKRNNPDIASEYWSIENALDPNFVQAIIGTLNPVWHRVSLTTKKIINELSVLKTFLIDLFKLDSVSFYQNINSFVTEHTMSMSNKDSLWLMIPEASATIACSKDRVYRKLKQSSSSAASIDDYLLEEPPKWEQLMLIMDEINDEKTAKNDSEDGPILIACSSRTICHQIEKVLSNYRTLNTVDSRSYSFRKIMTKELKYQKWKKESSLLIRKMNIELKNVKSQKLDATKDDDVVISKTFTRNKFRDSNRRRNRGGSVMSKHNRLMNLSTENGEGEPNDDEIIELDSDDSDVSEYEFDKAMDDVNPDGMSETPEVEFDLYHNITNEINYECIYRNNEVIVSTFESINLEEIMPSYIICYEPNLTFVRMIELYQASLYPVKCFFMYYGESVEEQIYLNSIKHEKDSFTSLIREKANMPKFFSTEDDEQNKFNESFRNMNSKTRIAGGGLVATETNKVIVDMRDFNSQLPFVCHLAGLEVIPAMLTVGDYILSDEICVERKAVRDLIDSLENGRLNKQCESMFKWYSKPVLLIEFEEGKSFSFEPFTTGFLTNNSNKQVKSNDLEQLQLRMTALMRSFPRLSIIWSSSPFETAKIFKEIKMNQKGPDVEFALTAGTNGINNGTGYNEDALNVLKLIPGITDPNSILIMNKVKSLYDFCQMSMDEMSEIIGKDNARKAFTFINKKYK